MTFRTTFLAGLLIFTLLALPGAARGNEGIIYSVSDDRVVEIPLTVHTPYYTISGTGVSVDGYESHNAPGEPTLPVWGTVVELPATGEWSLSYESVGTETLLGAPRVAAAPVPDLSRLSQEYWTDAAAEPIPTMDRPDPAVYEKDALFPTEAVATGDVQWQRGKRLLAVRAYPFQYNPISGMLLYHPELRIRVTVRGVQPDGGSRGPEHEALNRLSETNNPPASLSGSLRIRVTQSGMHRLTHGELSAAGVPVSTIDPATFAIHYLGEPVSIRVTGEADGHFDPQDLVIFYAEAYEGRYMRENIYWFTHSGGTPSPRIGSRSVIPTGGEPVLSEIRRSQHVERDRVYLSTSGRASDRDHFYDSVLYPVSSSPTRSVTYTLELKEPLRSGNVRLTAVLHGTLSHTANPDKSIDLQLNGQSAGIFQWDGTTEYTATATVDASLLDQTDNLITLEASLSHFPPGHGVGYFAIYPDWVRIDYPSLATAQEDRLHIEEIASGRNEVVVSGFSSDAAEVYDIRDPRAPVRLATVESVEQSRGYAVHFWDTELPSPTYYLSTNAALLAPSAIEADTPSTWKQPVHRANYIAIVHSSLRAAVQPLLDRRASEGLAVAVVDVQDVYDEFSAGRIDPEALRDFLSFAYHYWNPGDDPPEYVVLVGDGHYDYRGATSTPQPLLIPPYLANVDPWDVEAAADNRLVSVDGPSDYLPDMHLGRIPARTPAETSNLVSKILRYETNAPGGAWQQRVVYVADAANDPAGNFHALSDHIRDTWLPPAYDDQGLYFRSSPALESGDGMRAAIRQAFNDDAFLIQWFGHGAAGRWGSVSMFNVYDVPLLNANEQWPFTIALGCSTSNYANLQLNLQALGETLVLTADRGSIADQGATGKHTAGALIVMNRGTTRAMFQERLDRVGRASDAGKLYFFANSSSWHDVIDTTIILGDPATRLRLPAMPRLLASELSASSSTPHPGAPIAFELALVNDGTAPASDVVVTLDYDQNALGNISAPGAADNGSTLTWQIDSLAVGTQRLAIQAVIQDDVPVGSRVTTSAVIRAAGQFDVVLSQFVTIAQTPMVTATPTSTRIPPTPTSTVTMETDASLYLPLLSRQP